MISVISASKLANSNTVANNNIEPKIINTTPINLDHLPMFCSCYFPAISKENVFEAKGSFSIFV
jgi:hypothetical protein